jgi:hypothetical protein
MADRSFDVRVKDNSGLGNNSRAVIKSGIALFRNAKTPLTFTVGQLRENARVDVFLGPQTHSARQINAPYMFLVTCGSMASPIPQTRRCYAYMHDLFRFTNARVKPRVHE